MPIKDRRPLKPRLKRLESRRILKPENVQVEDLSVLDDDDLELIKDALFGDENEYKQGELMATWKLNQRWKTSTNKATYLLCKYFRSSDGDDDLNILLADCETSDDFKIDVRDWLGKKFAKANQPVMDMDGKTVDRELSKEIGEVRSWCDGDVDHLDYDEIGTSFGKNIHD